MATSKVPPPPATPARIASSGPTGPATKIRAGMGDVEADFIEVWTEEAEQRATGLLTILGMDGKADRAAAPKLEPARLIEMYRSMLLLRMLDERLMTMQRQGRIAFYAESRGQEAAVIGSVSALTAEDFVVPSHRETGAALYRGLPLRTFLAQLMGNANDLSKGRQMPVHPAAPRALNFLPPSSCVATQLPQATGIAWAAKLRGKKIAVLAYLGEGATSAEDFHAGINFAAVFHTPAVFLCQNNQWAISTPASQQTASQTFAIKALAYGMPGVRVDGNDVLAVHAATAEAVLRAKRGEGPTLIEAVTYRMGAHSTSDDPERYRDQSLLAEWERKDPLARLRLYLAAEKILDEKAETSLRATIEQQIKDAVAAEESVGPPALDTLIDDVFAQPTTALKEQLADLKRIRARRS